jgi:hypothetical protein
MFICQSEKTIAQAIDNVLATSCMQTIFLLANFLCKPLCQELAVLRASSQGIST